MDSLGRRGTRGDGMPLTLYTVLTHSVDTGRIQVRSLYRRVSPPISSSRCVAQCPQHFHKFLMAQSLPKGLIYQVGKDGASLSAICHSKIWAVEGPW
jgi:hypothetical protein